MLTRKENKTQELLYRHEARTPVWIRIPSFPSCWPAKACWRPHAVELLRSLRHAEARGTQQLGTVVTTLLAAMANRRQTACSIPATVAHKFTYVHPVMHPPLLPKAVLYFGP